MSAPILTTKFYFPPARSSFVSRPRLVEKLEHGLSGPLTLISAPAGYGKTTLMSEWRNGIGREYPLAWLSLDANDNDLARFISYFTFALASSTLRWLAIASRWSNLRNPLRSVKSLQP